MELYNNNSSYLQDFSNEKQVRVVKKKKGAATQPAKSDIERISGSMQNQDSNVTENVGNDVQSQLSEDSTSPENSQPKHPESTNVGMNFANRYK